MTLPSYMLRQLCIKNNWFDLGCNSQYKKLFGMNENNAPISELALAIWVCTEEEPRDVIENQLRSVQIP